MKLYGPPWPEFKFEAGGYAFFCDNAGFWNVSKDKYQPPLHCAYASAYAIAKLKGVSARQLPPDWSE